MLHHMSFGVTNLERSTAFYDAALTALGYGRVWADAAFVVDPDGYRVEAVINEAT